MLARNHNRIIDSRDSVALVSPKFLNRQQCRGNNWGLRLAGSADALLTRDGPALVQQGNY